MSVELMLWAVHAFALDASSPLADIAEKARAAAAHAEDPARANIACTIDRGSDALMLRLHLIRSATSTIDIQTFIWGGDETSRLLAYELHRAAERGVKVRLLLDFMGAVKEDDGYAFDRVVAENIAVKIYRPVGKRIAPSAPRFLASVVIPNGINQRMHNKTMVVDGALGITGGRNVANEYFDYTTGHNFIDQEVLVAGPAVDDMTREFDAFWESRLAVRNEDLSDVQAYLNSGEHPPPSDKDSLLVGPYLREIDRAASDTATIAERFAARLLPVEWLVFISDAPGKKASLFLASQEGGSVAGVLRNEIQRTREELLIQSPYVILTRKSRKMFKKQRKKNPDLTVQVSSNSFGAADHYETYSATFRLRSQLVLGLGFQLHEMNPYPADLPDWLPHYAELEQRAETSDAKRAPFLSIHSKVFIFDARRAFVGSFNLDPRSQNLNSECGVLIEDARMVQALRESFLQRTAPENSWVVAEVNDALAVVNRPFEFVSGVSPIDIWPMHNTSSFALKDGGTRVPPDHEDFYEHYEDAGRFPGSEGLPLEKLQTSVYKTVGKFATPFL